MEIGEAEVSAFLEHYGVKGMKWGVRKDHIPDVPIRTSREAKRDAQEFARAKMFYGEGAGTRRKLIKNAVEDKSKRDPAYAKAFAEHLARQNMADHAEKAKKERVRTDRKDKTKKSLSYLARKYTGEMGTVAAFTALAAAGAAFMASEKGHALMKKGGGKVRDLATNFQTRTQMHKGATYLNDYFRRNS